MLNQDYSLKTYTKFLYHKFNVNIVNNIEIDYGLI